MLEHAIANQALLTKLQTLKGWGFVLVTSDLDLDTDLRLALEREQFQLHYQPIVNLQSQRLVGFESLIRWCHPSRGMIPPNHFIPLAEKIGLILAIGDWVIERACRQIQHWQQRFEGNTNWL